MSTFWNLSIAGTTDQTSGWKPVKSEGRSAQHNVVLQAAYTALGTPNGVVTLQGSLDSTKTNMVTDIGTAAINAANGSFKFQVIDNPWNEFKLNFDINDCSTTTLLVLSNI
jgi:hypothetical protein